MPTILRIESYRFFFFSNEGNEPPHIHVERGGGIAKFWLDPVGVAYCKGLSKAEFRRARQLVGEYRDLFVENWHEYFST